MKTLLLPALTVAALALAGFTLTSAARPAPAVATPSAAQTFAIDPVHSTLIFSTTHLGTSRSYGRFDDLVGSITLDDAKPEASKVEITVRTQSVDTDNKGRDDHLRGPDFFDVKQFPTATFRSTRVERTADKTWSVTGDLDLHGVKKEVKVALEEVGRGKGRDGEALIGFHGTFSIQRADFGITYGKGMLGDEVDLIVSVEAAAK